MSTENVPAVDFAMKTMSRGLAEDLKLKGWTAAQLAEHSSVPLEVIELHLAAKKILTEEQAEAIENALYQTPRN